MSDLTEKLEKQKVVIGGLVNNADAHAKKVLAAYSPAHSYNTNLANVVKCNAQQLESCALLLKVKARSDDGKTKLYKNKETLADRIILKIESLFEAECSDCKVMYQNTLDSVPDFTCRLCLLGSHDCEEIKKKVLNVGAPTPVGFVWICHVCLQKNDLQNMLPQTATKIRVRTLSQKSSSYKGSYEMLNAIPEEGEEDAVGEKDEEEGETTEAEEEEQIRKRVSPRRGDERNQKSETPMLITGVKGRLCVTSTSAEHVHTVEVERCLWTGNHVRTTILNDALSFVTLDPNIEMGAREERGVNIGTPSFANTLPRENSVKMLGAPFSTWFLTEGCKAMRTPQRGPAIGEGRNKRRMCKTGDA